MQVFRRCHFNNIKITLFIPVFFFIFSTLAISEDKLSITYGGKFIYSMYGGSETTGDDSIYFKDSSGFSYKAYSNPKNKLTANSRLEDYSSYFITHFNYKVNEEHSVGSSIYANMAGQIRLFTKSDSKIGDWTAQTRMRVNGEMFNSQYLAEHPEIDGGWFYLSYAYARIIHDSGFTMKLGSAQNIDMYIAGYDVVEKISFRQNNMKDALFTTNESMFSAFNLGYTGYNTNTEVYLGLSNANDLVYNNGSNQTSSFSTGGVCVINSGADYHRKVTQRCYNPSYSNANDTLEGDTEQTTILGARSYGKATAGSNLYYGVEINYFKNNMMTSNQEQTPASDAFMVSAGISYRFMQENSKMIEPFINVSMVRKSYTDLYTASTAPAEGEKVEVDGKGGGYNDQYTFNIGTNFALNGGLLDDGYINLGFITQRFDNKFSITEGEGVGDQYGYNSRVNGVDIIYAKGFSKEITGFTGVGFSKIYILDDYSVENNTNFHYNEYNLGFGLVAKL